MAVAVWPAVVSMIVTIAMRHGQVLRCGADLLQVMTVLLQRPCDCGCRLVVAAMAWPVAWTMRIVAVTMLQHRVASHTYAHMFMFNSIHTHTYIHYITYILL